MGGGKPESERQVIGVDQGPNNTGAPVAGAAMIRASGDDVRYQVIWREYGDGTADVSRDGGKSWSREFFPIRLPSGDWLQANGYVTR